MQDGLLRKVKHLGDVEDLLGRALDARLDLFPLVHDGHNLVVQSQRRRLVASEVNLVADQYDWDLPCDRVNARE